MVTVCHLKLLFINSGPPTKSS